MYNDYIYIYQSLLMALLLCYTEQFLVLVAVLQLFLTLPASL